MPKTHQYDIVLGTSSEISQEDMAKLARNSAYFRDFQIEPTPTGVRFSKTGGRYSSEVAGNLQRWCKGFLMGLRCATPPTLPTFPFPVEEAVVDNLRHRVFIASGRAEYQWFMSTPLPDNLFRITVKRGETSFFSFDELNDRRYRLLNPT